MADINIVALIVAVVGAGGLGAFARELADIAAKLRSGVSAREAKRKEDIIVQRDAAVARAETEMTRRIAWQEYAAALRRQLRENGIEPRDAPDGEDTDP